AIDWPVTEDNAILSEKDKKQPKLSELETNFVYRP
ncbi:dTDP-4-keto-6-deoxy-D-glucose epimerase, partial [Agrobacterium vitis]|nr:dTDP-4-keto-6-deoxy-D-glucose epimerase [Allorhizobium ampelinum]